MTKRTLNTLKTFAEAEHAERLYYRSLTPSERMNILLTLVAHQNDARQTDETAQRPARVYRIVKRI